MIKRLGLAIALVAIIFFAFANAVRHPFVHDDVVFIVNNPNLNKIDLAEIFLTPSHATLNGSNAYYRPLLEVIYRLEYAAFGLDPHAFHAVNIVWHALNALLVFWLCTTLAIPMWFAWSVALFFGVHPVQSEAVSCVAGISNIAVTSFMLLAWIAYIHRWLIMAVLMLAIGFFAKETVLAMIPLMLMTDWLLRRRQIMAWGLLFFVALQLIIWRQAITDTRLFEVILAHPQELLLRVLHIPTALLIYVKSIIWPVDLHYYRNLDVLTPWWPSWIILGLILVLLKFMSPNDRAERRIFWFGIGVFVLALLPILNVVPLINEYSLILVADHFVYLPVVGILISLGCLLRQWLLPVRRFIIVAITVLLCLMLTIYQNMNWQSEVALFEHVVKHEPKFGRGHVLLAKAYYFAKRYRKAIETYDKAQFIFEGYLSRIEDPNAKRFYEGFLKGIHFEKAQSYSALKLWVEAEREYIQAIHFDEKDTALYINLAAVIMTQSQWDRAKTVLEQALAIDPINFNARNNLAICLANTGHLESAKSIWQQILIENPNYLPAQQNLRQNP